jgi:hypothetical protein
MHADILGSVESTRQRSLTDLAEKAQTPLPFELGISNNHHHESATTFRLLSEEDSLPASDKPQKTASK